MAFLRETFYIKRGIE